MRKETKIKNFWDNQAKEFKGSHLATEPDTYYRELEIESIMHYLKDGKNLLDVGCGNGYSAVKFAKKFSRMKIIGIDYSKEMIRCADESIKRQRNIRQSIRFEIGDVLNLSGLVCLKNQKFDYIVSERCLINLLNWKQQKKGLLEMRNLLRKNGRIILCENTQEGLRRLNSLRIQQGLAPILLRWHNYYLPEKKLDKFLKDNFIIEGVKNIAGTYRIISRVVYAKLCDMNKTIPHYLHPINKIASRLPQLGNYSANYIFLLKNKGS